MRKLKLLLLSFIALSLYGLQAQNSTYPWQFNIGTNAVDFYPASDGSDPYLGGGMFDNYFNLRDHYNVAYALSEFQVGRYLGSNFSILGKLTANDITRYGKKEVNNAYWGLDLNFKWAPVNKKFDPYMLLGGGYTWYGRQEAGNLNGGLGFNYWLGENFGLYFESVYKKTFDPNVHDYFQHSAGLVLRFGAKDSDKDGIVDKEDECPNTPGLAEFNGCPDTDGDGIADKNDDCPKLAGPAKYNGCPDRDGDGVIDPNDKCPDVAGLAKFAGCPDTDGDGVVDNEDDCPKVAGPAANKGCPWPDTDGDGVVDKDDLCPNVAGPADNKGCPKITKEEQAKLKQYAKVIYFKTNSAEFTKKTYPILDAIVVIMKKYPASRFRIEGHTDSVGSAEYNQKLSERRANAVRDYLIQHGISADRLEAKGYGESKPIASNRTASGRAKNRRVEINLID